MATVQTIPSTNEKKDALERFSNYLYARCGLAETTVDLTVGFVRRMAPHTGLHPAHADIDRYIADMRRRGDSYSNVSNAIKAVEHYMQFLGDPIHLGRPRKPQKTGVATLSEGKIAVLISAAKTLRERSILALLAYTGIRNRELTQLCIRDVDVPQQTVMVECGKGAKGRACCVAGECMEILADYLRERAAEPDDLLFVTVRHAHPLQTQDVRKLVRTVAKRAGIKKRVWPHLLRHSLATALLGRGASVYSIQALLGHTFVSTTLEYYLHPSAKTVRADYNRYAPSFV
jgi:integrase/recombinase XerD